MTSQSVPEPATARSDFQRGLIAMIPQLRAFAGMLCRHRSRAEDLAQETLTKAWRAQDRFEAGTNLKAWLFTIMRNEFHSQRRRSWREAHWDEGAAERVPAPADAQLWTLELCDTAHALQCLPDDQREALILVGAAGFSYSEAAEISRAPLGTVKSRVARGRQALAEMRDGTRKLTRSPRIDQIGGFDDILSQLTAIAPAAEHSTAFA